MYRPLRGGAMIKSLQAKRLISLKYSRVCMVNRYDLKLPCFQLLVRSCTSAPDSKKSKNLSNEAISGESVKSSSTKMSGGTMNYLVTISKGIIKVTISGFRTIISFCYDVIRNPSSIPGKLQIAYDIIVDTIHHYYVGSKLLWEEMKLTSQILNRLLRGHDMTRRERMQLMRTTGDMFRLVPFMVFVIVPFMELLLPLTLKIFPNMLPSTFQDKLKREERMKQELQMRLAVAGFLQDTLHDMVNKSKKFQDSKDAASAKEVLEFMEMARRGQPLNLDSVLRIARLFKDELTLANIARPQLVMMCQFMGLPPYGTDAFLRFQLRTKMRMIKEDDRRILWEGISSLSKLELREACRDRGMRSVGLTTDGYKHQLNEWLELSIQKNVPVSLLVTSRAFTLQASVSQESVLRDSLSSLDDEVVNEVVLEAARSEEHGTVEMRTRMLESLQFQKELIEEEFEDKGAAASVASSGEGMSKTLSGGSSSPDNDSARTADDQVTATTPVEGAGIMDRVTIAEVQALGELALTSSVERERAELALLKNRGEDLIKDEGSVTVKTETPASGAKADVFITDSDLGVEHGFVAPSATIVSPLVVKQVAAKESDAGTANLRRALDSMLGKLEVRIAKTEKALENLPRLDLDGDGVVDAEELREAVLQVLKRHSNEQAQDLINLLDKDKDGQVTVSEILEWVRLHSEAKKN